MSTYVELMQGIFQRYEKEVNSAPALLEVARRAIDKGLWSPRLQDVYKLCAKDLANALRQEYLIDDQGHRVRAKHAVRKTEKGKRMSFYW